MHIFEPLAQFGVAGLMGVLWVWERALSRKRDNQLDATHRRLMSRDEQTRLLIHTIKQNTRVIERFEQTQRLVIQLLERTRHETNDAHVDGRRAD